MQSESRIGFPGANNNGGGVSLMAAQSMQRQQHQQHFNQQQQQFFVSGSTCQQQQHQSYSHLQAHNYGQQPQLAAYYPRTVPQQQHQTAPQEPSSQTAQQQVPAGAYHRQRSSQVPYTSSEPNYLEVQARKQNAAYRQEPLLGDEHLQVVNSSLRQSPNHKHQLTRYVAQQQRLGCHNDYAQPNSHQQVVGCSPMVNSQEMMVMAQQQQQAQFFGCGAPGQCDQVIAQTQAVLQPLAGRAEASHGLIQPRPRVNSISTTRREPTPTTRALYSSKMQVGGGGGAVALTRSLSFSASGPAESLVSRSRPQPPMALDNGEVFCLEGEGQRRVPVIPGASEDQPVAGGGSRCLQYYETYRTHLAPGSMSSACSSIGSPVPMMLSSETVSPPIGNQPRPISSNSSNDGHVPIYQQQRQQQQQIAQTNNNNHYQQHHNSAQIQQKHPNQTDGSTTTTASSCGSSIISTSDSMSMSINLEQYISKRNERERSRVRNVNDAFDNLKNSLPLDVEKMSKRMSKVEILRTAIGYIRNLEQVLGYKPQFSGCDDSMALRFEHGLSSSSAAKRLGLNRSFRRLDVQHLRQRKQYKSSDQQRAHHDHCHGGKLAHFTSSTPSGMMIERDDNEEDYFRSGGSTGDLERRFDEFEGQQPVESDQEQADGSRGGDSRGSCMEHQFDEY